MPVRALLLLVAYFVASASHAADVPSARLTITPDNVLLSGKDARQRLIVTATADGRATDRTRAARYQSETPAVVQVSADGIVIPIADGMGSVSATVDGQQVKA